MQTEVKLTSRQKAAVFCIQVGADCSAEIFRHLADGEIEALTVEIARADKVSAETCNQILQEFVEMATQEQYVRGGGLHYAREVLEKALGRQRAREILVKLTASIRRKPFDSLRNIDPSQLAGYLQNEHPQTIAVVMAHLPPYQAAQVMAGMPPERQADVIRRVSSLDRISPDMLREAEKVLEKKLLATGAQEERNGKVGGIQWAVDVLNSVDRSTERNVMETLSVWDPDLATEISQRMFVFEDIVKLDNRTLQRILREVDFNRDLPLAMKGAKEEVWEKITGNLSNRMAQALRESVEYLGPVRIREVEEAQNRIINLIRSLEERGEIQINRGGEDEFI